MPDVGVDALPADADRSARVAEDFRRRTGRPAAFVARAPGRVNLLGEHTDYNGLPVLPMAIDRSILIAGAPRADRIMNVANTAAAFTSREFAIADSIPPYAPGDWGNYVKAATQGIVRYGGVPIAHGADLLVDGDIPRGAGLSSSSAVVVASALAILAANEAEIPYPALAEMLPSAERYVGTLSGGMDQAISLLARAGHALRIDFFPLRVRTVPLPAACSIVVCHSLVQAEKSGAAKRAYNLRVIEGRLVCRVMETALGTSLPRPLQTLGDLTALFPGRPLVDFLSYVTALVQERPLVLEEVAAAIGTGPERLRLQCEIAPDIAGPYALVRRARHVLSEAERVNHAVETLERGDAVRFGQLMDASHGSCRDDYEISCPALEELVRIAKEAGALGARLTGAGFGGCTVNLVRAADLPAFLTRIERYFYRSRMNAGERGTEHSFVFRPHSGASVLRP